MTQALDLSNFQGAATQQEVDDAWEQGYRLVIVNMYGPFAAQQLSAYWARGFRLQVYCYLNFPGGQFWSGVSSADQVTGALDKAAGAGLPVERIWLDCEDEGNSLDAPGTVNFIQKAADACIGRMYSGIYTAPGWWTAHTGDSQAFAGYALWLATNDRIPDLALPVGFGGWVQVAMEQYDFHGRIDEGLPEVDLDIERDPAPAPQAEFVVQQGDEDDMADRIKVEGTQDIGILNQVAARSLGMLVSSDQSGGVSAYVRRGPSVDLPAAEEELIIRVPAGTIGTLS